MDVSSWVQVLRQFSLHNLFLDQLIEGMKTRGSVAFGVALCLCNIVLEGCNLGLEQLVE